MMKHCKKLNNGLFSIQELDTKAMISNNPKWFQGCEKFRKLHKRFLRPQFPGNGKIRDLTMKFYAAFN
jgi:hypothetical protein